MLVCDNCGNEYLPGQGDEQDGKFELAEHNHPCPSCGEGTIWEEN